MSEVTLESHIGETIARMHVASERAASETGFEIRRVIITGMRDAKSGRQNLRRGILRSAPGESPAIDYGNLVNSIFVIATGDEVTVGTNDPKAQGLEFGTARVSPRPFLGPAFEQVAEGFEARLQREFSGV